jgi:hypothetical protein
MLILPELNYFSGNKKPPLVLPKGGLESDTVLKFPKQGFIKHINGETYYN